MMLHEVDDHSDENSKLVGVSGGSDRYRAGQKVLDCEQIIRLGFIRKVYGILSVQLLATVAICACSMLLTSNHTVGNFEVLSLGSFLVSSRAFYWFIFIVTFAILFGLMCFRNSYPINFVLLSVWTVALSFSVATACVVVMCDPMVQTASGGLVPMSQATSSAHLYQGEMACAVGTEQFTRGTKAVLMALGITAAIFVGATIFTFQSKWDFSFLGAGLSASLFILILWGFGISIFGGGAHVQYLYSLAGALIFSIYIIFDTWMISCKYGPDDYIMAAIDLYLDILNLFLMILQLLTDNRRR